jgi:hypothetical protein
MVPLVRVLDFCMHARELMKTADHLSHNRFSKPAMKSKDGADAKKRQELVCLKRHGGCSVQI